MEKNLLKIKKLNQLLKTASIEYYQNSKSIITDLEYDKLYDELVNLENKTCTIFTDSVTQNVEFLAVSKLDKIIHKDKILSLNKTKSVEEVENFLENMEAILSFKLDGLTVVLEYKNGVLYKAITRGNGEIGEDITHNAKVFKNLPIKINYQEDLTIRGEAMISFSEFENINESLHDEEKYKNPRNLCSGTVRQLNNEVCSKRNVDFIAFSVITSDNKRFNLKSEQLEWLTNLGFTTVKRELVNKNNVSRVIKEFQKSLDTFEFATDGLVITFNNIEESKKMGKTAKFPKDSLAFKWKDEIAETTLKEIIWNTSRTGLINPVAIFDSVELEGTAVSRASLHNLSIVENLKLGIGDTITVYKANMIIPQVAENLTKSDTFHIPENCQVCNHKAKIIITKDGKALKCTNINCPAQIIRSISHFVSRDAMNVDGLSEAIIKKFIDFGFITNFTSIYKLESFREEIENLKGFGKKSYINLISSIENSKNVHLGNFINALGINNIGLVNSKRLVKHFNGNLEKIINSSYEDIMEVDGFGNINAQSLINYFNNEKNKMIIYELLEYLNILYENNQHDKNESKISNLIFVVTGDLYQFKGRKELQSKIEEFGGKVTKSISTKTNYLINNDLKSNSAKNKKAKELNIPIISELDFIEMIR